MNERLHADVAVHVEEGEREEDDVVPLAQRLEPLPPRLPAARDVRQGVGADDRERLVLRGHLDGVRLLPLSGYRSIARQARRTAKGWWRERRTGRPLTTRTSSPLRRSAFTWDAKRRVPP